MPSVAKKYFDNVLMEAGTVQNKLWLNDGRTRETPNANYYGTGGISQNKKYMIIVTINAPKEAFLENHFFDCDLDKLLISVHKMFQFLGMKPLKSLSMNDVIKNPNIERYTNDLENHLDEMIELLK
ncbi:MAG: NAD(P)H-dependent oxidoreductase [Ureaplasma sp.]|nr:NAD(P)H-dependent oxidoreductase [Ureaplasma sp.]MDE7222093.1 NAD(P)H-dependent oxidoreductase [Ureaplasma sp.]